MNQLDKVGKLSDIAQFKEAIHNRESQSTTGIEKELLFLTQSSKAVKSPTIAFGKSKEGVDYQSLDGQPNTFILYDCRPEGGAQTHLDALAKLSGILMDDKVRESLLHANLLKKCFKLLIMDDEATKEEEKKHKNKNVATSGSANTTDANEPYVLVKQDVPQVSHIPIWFAMH